MSSFESNTEDPLALNDAELLGAKGFYFECGRVDVPDVGLCRNKRIGDN